MIHRSSSKIEILVRRIFVLKLNILYILLLFVFNCKENKFYIQEYYLDFKEIIKKTFYSIDIYWKIIIFIYVSFLFRVATREIENKDSLKIYKNFFKLICV